MSGQVFGSFLVIVDHITAAKSDFRLAKVIKEKYPGSIKVFLWAPLVRHNGLRTVDPYSRLNRHYRPYQKYYDQEINFPATPGSYRLVLHYLYHKCYKIVYNGLPH